MVSVSAILLGVTTLSLSALQYTNAAPIESNPFMNVNRMVVLDKKNPAFGAKIIDPIYKVIANHSLANPIEEDSRRLEANNDDIQRMEAALNQRFERNLKRLPESGEFSPVPWPGSYWPVYMDGINARWHKTEPSAAEKYARAFKLDVKQFMDGISKNNGILSQSHSKRCSSKADCQDRNDGSTCGIRPGETSGYCIPTWFGICHAWAPAAILEPEPRCSVTKNGVTFRPYDIKALITQVYDGARVNTVFTGARFDGDDNGPKDKFGRYADYAHRDLGPGFFHIAFSNMLGRFKQSFVLDVDAGSQVWNQPVRGYRVVRQTPMSVYKGARHFYRRLFYPFNKEAKSLMYVETEFSWILEAGEDGPLVSTRRVDRYTKTVLYTYLLELDDNDNIIGGEWIGNSNEDHPDFLWFSVEKPADNVVTNVGIRYRDVKELIDASTNGSC